MVGSRMGLVLAETGERFDAGGQFNRAQLRPLSATSPSAESVDRPGYLRVAYRFTRAGLTSWLGGHELTME